MMLPVDATDLSWCSDGFDGYNDVGSNQSTECYKNEEDENEHGRPSGVSNHPKK
jgi:hypothetical protein